MTEITESQTRDGLGTCTNYHFEGWLPLAVGNLDFRSITGVRPVALSLCYVDSAVELRFIKLNHRSKALSITPS